MAARGHTRSMAERPPPDPREPVDPLDETIVRDEWGEETIVVDEREDVVPPRRPPLIWPWLLAFLVLVLGGLGAYLYFSQDDDEPVATTTSTAQTTTAEALVKVPDVVGTTSSEATATLREAGFDVDVVAVPSERPSGQVVAQDPAAGVESPKGTQVRLNVAQEAPATTTAATTKATTAPPPTTIPATTTTPPATTAPVPTPPRPATVPDVVGQELADAARAFGDEGLKVSVKPVPSNEARGTVVAQAQPAGTERKRGDTVQINVALGADPPANAAVPGTAGLPQQEARDRLEAARFEVLAIELEVEDRSREGRVLSQTPSAGAQIPSGSLVILYVGVATS
jgi:beta-lactam-binding protein with PASTA domain